MMCIFSACSDLKVIMLGGVGKKNCWVGWKLYNVTSRRYVFNPFLKSKHQTKVFDRKSVWFRNWAQGTERYVCKIYLENVNPRGGLPPRAQNKYYMSVDVRYVRKGRDETMICPIHIYECIYMDIHSPQQQKQWRICYHTTPHPDNLI